MIHPKIKQCSRAELGLKTAGAVLRGLGVGKAGRVTAFRTTAASAGSWPGPVPGPPRPVPGPSKARLLRLARLWSPASTLPPQSPESPSPWQQPEKGPAEIFMAQNSPRLQWGEREKLMSFLLLTKGRTDMQLGGWAKPTRSGLPGGKPSLGLQVVVGKGRYVTAMTGDRNG